jgi:hypothetical protein
MRERERERESKCEPSVSQEGENELKGRERTALESTRVGGSQGRARDLEDLR